MDRQQVQVHSLCGSRIHQRPVSFQLEGRSVLLKEILDQWCQEDARRGGERRFFFLVEGENGTRYRLCYCPGEDSWYLYQVP